MKREYSISLTEVLKYSKEEAIRLNNDFIGPEHLFLGIIRNSNCEAAVMLQNLDINLSELKQKIDGLLEKSSQDNYIELENLSLTKTSERIFRFMYSEAISLNSNEVNTLHLLLAILKVPSRFSQILDEFNIEYGMLKMTLESSDLLPLAFSDDEEEDDDDDDEDFNLDSMFSHSRSNSNSNSKMLKSDIFNNKRFNTPYLDAYGIDLTLRYRNGNECYIVGRDIEVNRIVQILTRLKKNNPILVGEPGVGKSAIVESLAARVARKEVPSQFQESRIISLNLALLVAGTKYRGQFEERMLAIIEELKHNKDVILFIDEIHVIVGAGSASGTLDAANMLKPALASGEVRCIGSTTFDEYRNSIGKDKALERRFQKVIVEQNTLEETLHILRNNKNIYETHHKVSYTDDALEACVKLTSRYVSDRVQPDKALDALDEVGAQANTAILAVPSKIIKLEKKLELTNLLKLEAVKDQLFEKAAALRDEAREIEKDIEKAKDKWQNSLDNKRKTVNQDNVAGIISMMTGIPVTKIAQTESSRLLNMKAELNKKIIGQEDAIESIVKSIFRSRTGIKDPNKPIGTFIFLGNTGVGKTQLAKVLANYLFDSSDSIIRIDMSEYMEKHSVSRLIGAPPGYVGYEEGGQLSEKVRRRPYSIILLDEIEKAHHDVFNILLQVLDEGRLTDGHGKTVDFRNTILIMTSNIGTKQVAEYGKGLGFYSNNQIDTYNANAKSIIEKNLKKTFLPEFLNRIDDVILFNSLKKEHIVKIIDIELEGLTKRVNDLGYILKISDAAKSFVADKGFDNKNGARPLKRAIQTLFEDKLAEFILKENLIKGDTISINYDETDKIVINIGKVGQENKKLSKSAKMKC